MWKTASDSLFDWHWCTTLLYVYSVNGLANRLSVVTSFTTVQHPVFAFHYIKLLFTVFNPSKCERQYFQYFLSKSPLTVPPNQKLACFVLYLKIINTFLKRNICIFEQIVQETQKWHWNFSRPSGIQVMDQNSQNIVMINNSRTA